MNRWLAVLIGCCAFTGAAHAAMDYPNRPVHLVVGLPPGGGSDTLARLISQKLSEKWNQAVIVDNRPGADGSIAAEYTARSAPDGYTIFLPSTNLTIPAEGYTPNYDPIKSFTPVTLVANVPDVMVINPTLIPAKSLKEMAAFAKTKPGQLNFGSGGVFQFLQMAVLMKQLGIKMVNINYKGGNPAMLATMSGEVQSMFGSVAAVSQQVKAGKVRAIAIGGTQRSSVLPDVPTFQESGVPDMEAGWYGVLGPAGMDSGVAAKLHDDIVAVMKLSDVQRTMSGLGFFPVGDSAQEYGQIMKHDVEKWSAILKTVDTKNRM